MIDTRYYAVVSKTSDLATAVEENSAIKRQNYYLFTTIIMVTVAMGILFYQNHILEREKKLKAIA